LEEGEMYFDGMFFDVRTIVHEERCCFGEFIHVRAHWDLTERGAKHSRLRQRDTPKPNPMGRAEHHYTSESPASLDVSLKQPVPDCCDWGRINVAGVRADERAQDAIIRQRGRSSELSFDDCPKLRGISGVKEASHGWWSDYF
jgi:hypothetical protein